MAADQVMVRELVAWGFDENAHRPALATMAMERSCGRAAIRRLAQICSPVLSAVPATVESSFAEQLKRRDLHEEMQGIDWHLGVVDLRNLFAFQRRLVFDEHFPYSPIPSSEDWEGLVALAFGPPVPIAFDIVVSNPTEYVIQSENPGLHVRQGTAGICTPFELHGGSPFVEVAEYRGRWFLRDGYHRAFHLLRSNVTHLPAVIIRARTIDELGAVKPWFFSEDVLFSSQAPRVIDFLDDALTFEYARPRMLKTIRLNIEESVGPTFASRSSGERS